MKKNAPAIVLMVFEYIVAIAPIVGYSIYTYVDTLQYTMTPASKGSFWSIIACCIMLFVLFSIFKKKYDRYVQGFVQQKTDLETNPENELLIKQVTKKATIIENIDWLIPVLPLTIALCVVHAFSGAIEQLETLLMIVIGSLVGKVGLHCAGLQVSKNNMLGKLNKKDGE